ncbi:UPF0047 protein YjbQ [Cucumis melo var. makuwa]|uniref:UPF0047 protein YjbQ n=1 Tax=Cucumis melo var. makuwa TaxID=1194695 RepID=A0A5D3D8K7_CUCMM|nr:UPF0047 protein YjbQ [Cucumis melo var. makuwa]TYK19898.1 UPF0047 protein YjbQ [Cucumis melo var. makuwa]
MKDDRHSTYKFTVVWPFGMQGAIILAAQPLRVKLLRSNNSSTGNPSATAGSSNPSLMAAAGPKWAQKTVTLSPHRRGCHLITPKIMKEIGQDLSEFKCGLAHIFLQHTSASLTINENYDSDVQSDTETFLNKIVPEGTSAPWKHTLEGYPYLLSSSKITFPFSSFLISSSGKENDADEGAGYGVGGITRDVRKEEREFFGISLPRSF